MLGVLYLEAVETKRRQLADLLLADPAARRMGKYRNSAGAMHHADDLVGVQRGLGDEGRFTDADEAPECLVGGLRRTVVHQRSCDVRPPDTAVAGGRLDTTELDAEAEVVETLDDCVGALAPVLARSHGRGEQAVVIGVNEQAQHVDLVPVEIGGELDACNDLEGEVPRRIARRRNPVEDVVVGDGEGVEANAVGFLDEPLRRQYAVGESRVGVQFCLAGIRDREPPLGKEAPIIAWRRCGLTGRRPMARCGGRFEFLPDSRAEAIVEFVISEEQRLVAETVRDFAWDVIEPNVREWDEAQAFPDEVMRQIGELGFLGGFVPEEYGGAGLNTVEYVTIVEEMARVDPSVTLSVAAHNSLCTGHVLLAGNEDQKKRYLPRLASGEWIGAWGLTEPLAGSDAAGTRATAVWKEASDHWVVNGNKTFNTNGARAQLAIVHAVTSPDKGSRGITAFAVETDRPGFQVGRKEDKLGCRASDTVELILENVELPPENVLGAPDEGFVDALRVLDAGRIGVAALSVGLAQGALDACLGYVRERHQFDRPIGTFPAIQAKLVAMASEVRAARCLTWKAAALKDAGEDFKQAASMAKLYASETAVRTAEQAVQIFGGYGFVKDYPVEKFYRDSKLCTIGEGTSEIQRLVISRGILGR